MKDESEMNIDTVEKIKKLMGEPRNYGPTPEEQEEIKRKEEEDRLKKDEEERLERERKEAEEAAERRRRQEEWVGSCFRAVCILVITMTCCWTDSTTGWREARRVRASREPVDSAAQLLDEARHAHAHQGSHWQLQSATRRPHRLPGTSLTRPHPPLVGWYECRKVKNVFVFLRPNICSNTTLKWIHKHDTEHLPHAVRLFCCGSWFKQYSVFTQFTRPTS